MKNKFVVIFCISNIIQPFFIQSSPILGFELNYSGDLKGNGDFSGNLFCEYDTDRIKFQVKLHSKNGKCKPEIKVLPIKHQKTTDTDYAINKTLTTSFDISANILSLIYHKEMELANSSQFENLYLEEIDRKISQGKERLKRAEMEIL